MRQNCSRTVYHHSDDLATTAQMPHYKKLHEGNLRIIVVDLLKATGVFNSLNIKMCCIIDQECSIINHTDLLSYFRFDLGTDAGYKHRKTG